MQPSSDSSWIVLNVRTHPMILILTVLSEGQCCICLLWVSVPQSVNGKLKGIRIMTCPMSLGKVLKRPHLLPGENTSTTIIYSCYGNLQWPHVPFVHVTFPLFLSQKRVVAVDSGAYNPAPSFALTPQVTDSKFQTCVVSPWLHPPCTGANDAQVYFDH